MYAIKTKGETTELITYGGMSTYRLFTDDSLQETWRSIHTVCNSVWLSLVSCKSDGSRIFMLDARTIVAGDSLALHAYFHHSIASRSPTRNEARKWFIMFNIVFWQACLPSCFSPKGYASARWVISVWGTVHVWKRTDKNTHPHICSTCTFRQRLRQTKVGAVVTVVRKFQRK